MDETTKSKSQRVVTIDERSPHTVTTTDTQDDRNVTDAEKDDETMMNAAVTVTEDIIKLAAQSLEDKIKHCTEQIQWITHGEFTAENGQRQIQELISACEYHLGWSYSTEFMRKEDVDHSFHYIYRVSWSLSTAQLPMARVYAIAYFTIKIKKNKPPDAPIDVSYVFEDQALVQRYAWKRMLKSLPP
ncbi:A-kinase anchor protein 14 isoform X2 [Cavia porcellus]|uniref:A-kinase anchor protein 14 isoform X2 n=1 Tax=Cavia porcellus TaxID=10141 RepID=UPI002FDF1D37